jgi:valyl-tRNA synthetase
MPFITEEIFHLLKEQEEDLTVKLQGKPKPADEHTLSAGSLLKEVITKLRDARNKNQLKPKDPVVLHIMADNTNGYKVIESILMKQVNASNVVYTTSAIANTIVVNIEKDKFFIEAEQQLDTAAIKDRLLKDLEYEQNFLASVMKKLRNEKFVQNAKPEIIALERKKQADAEARINTIEESLKSL